MYKLWTKREIDLLRKHYPTTLVRNLVLLFPKRNEATIVAKARNLGLPSAKLWQPKENRILHKYFSTYTIQELSKLLPRRSKTAIWAQGERLRLKQNRNHPRLAVNENYFKIWSNEMAYVLGFILADGCIIEGTYKGYSGALKFGVNKRDIDILEKIREKLSSQHRISFSTNDAVHLTITSQIIVNDLKNLGIIYRKSLHENVPNVPEKYIKDFIRGIVDGDGSISFDKRSHPTLSVCGGKRTISFIQNHFINKFNIYSKIGKIKKNEKSQYLFSIGYRSNSAKTLIDYLYTNSTLYLERKFKLAERSAGTKIKFHNRYSQEEKQVIEKLYKTMPKLEILKILPRRNWISVQGKASKLKVHKYNIKAK